MVDVTSTVVETTYTATSTLTTTAATPTSTEDDFYTVTTTFVPPAQTVCAVNGVPTVTYFYQGPAQTQYQVQYQTFNTWATVWVGQTQYWTYTDQNAQTQCWQGGGWYGV
ncbi:hypothetical protein SCUCBS95973_001554 [Sporothrix curviconia]|uniref:Uncharacterized protein n=1 Tax=Sporothrix curviconia TaxID=1260050 RepID=A0ABP0B066_9PEZI